MKHISRAAIAVILAVLVMAIMPAQVFADSLPEYISEVKVYIGDYKDAEKEGFKILNGDNGKPIDLNQGAGGGLGSKGDKAVYLGYKTTTKASEAITDLALMNMKGGYSVAEYEALMETQMKSQIIPFVDSFLVTINEYRENYKNGTDENKQKAEYVYEALNKFIDDDTGKGLGDLLLNETKYEMGDKAYNALSDEQKKEHADILTIIAQSNGKATLMMENLLVRAADTNENTWLDRFAGINYDNLVDATGMTPTDAETELAKLYDDDANILLDSWNNLRDDLLGYDEALAVYNEYVDGNKDEEVNKAIETFKNLDDNATEEEIDEAAKAYLKARNTLSEALIAIETVAIHDRLEETEYEDGTLLDFFTRDYDEVYDDITSVYPLVASLTDGQRAGLDLISLRELFVIALSQGTSYAEIDLQFMEETSIYDGVDRAVYQKGGVALTSDAMRAEVMNENLADNSIISGWSIASWVLTGAAMVACAGSIYAATVYSKMGNVIHESAFVENNFMEFETAFGRNSVPQGTAQEGEVFEALDPSRAAYSNSGVAKGLAIGFGVAVVILAAVSTYLTWRDMKAHYNVDFTPIPHYMVDEKDLIGYNKKGEKIVLKNQSAYYKAVESNLKDGDFKFDEIGALADMNGCVGQQWLALYANKSEAMGPIIASSLKAVVGKSDIPAGYTTGIHMFGSSAAFNLNSNLYDWNQSAKKVFVYFKTDDSAKTSTTGSNFTGGTLALTGGAGIAIGALATAFAMKPKKKKAEAEA